MSNGQDELDLSIAFTSQKPSDWYQRIAIVRSEVKREYFPTEEAYFSELECVERSQQVKLVIEKFGIEVAIIEATATLSDQLTTFKPDLCLNFTDSVRGSSTLASSIPGLMDLLGLRYVGSGSLALSINTNKYLTKKLLEVWDIPTPRGKLIRSPGQLDHQLRFPLIVKLNEEHSSIGIDAHSVVSNQRDLKQKVSELFQLYRQPILLEEYIEGDELTGVVLESKQKRVFVSRRVYPQKGEFKVLTFDTKWSGDMGGENQVHYEKAEINDQVLSDLKSDLRMAFDVLRMDDFARFDMIIDKYGNYYVIDCNVNPSFGPLSSLSESMRLAGIEFEKFLFYVMQRNRLDQMEE